MSKKVWLLFIVIFLTAAFLRIYRITQVPPGVNRDEASIGYTVYSLLKTGADEYGRHLPISFQSFGDWKLPFYMYTVAPFVYFFGLSEIAVRLPSAIFGIVSVVLTFFLVKKLSGNNNLSLLTMFLMAISPWHLHLSRVESESNTAVLLVIVAVLLFLKFCKQQRWYIVPSLLFFSLTYYTYAGNYIFTTCLLFGLIFLYYSAFSKTRWLLIGVLVFILFTGFIFSQTLLSANKTKLSGISIFSDPSIVYAKIEIPRNEHTNPSSIFTRFFHNRLIFGSERFLQNYLNSFSPQFLFIQGGENKAHNILDFGNMYIVEAPFLFLGIVFLLFNKKRREDKLILWWFFISPLAASITKDAPHTNRMFAIFPMLPLITAMGIMYGISLWKKYKKIMIGIIIVLFSINFGVYMDRYYVHFPTDEVASWGNGYKELAHVLFDKKYEGKQIIMTRPEYSPYIFLLFYRKYDPRMYQVQAQRYPPTEDGFLHVKHFDRFEFRQINWGEDLRTVNSVLIADPKEVPQFVRDGKYNVSEIMLPNSTSMFTLIQTQ